MMRPRGNGPGRPNPILALVAAWFILTIPAAAQDSSAQAATQGAKNKQTTTEKTDEQLARELQNPIADLIQVSIVSSFDFGLATGNGLQYTLTFQPVIPVRIHNSWNLISRPIFAIVDSPEGPQSRTTGSSDLVAQFYFSPQKATPLIWGFGLVLGVPTAPDATLGSEKWTLGPGLAIIKQTEHWIGGVLVNRVWSFAGDKNRTAVSLTTLEPTVSYAWGRAWTLALDAASTYNSVATSGGRWIEPVQLFTGRVTNLGRRPVTLSFGVTPNAVAPAGSPRVGVRFTITPLFPKK